MCWNVCAADCKQSPTPPLSHRIAHMSCWYFSLFSNCQCQYNYELAALNISHGNFLTETYSLIILQKAENKINQSWHSQQILFIRIRTHTQMDSTQHNLPTCTFTLCYICKLYLSVVFFSSFLNSREAEPYRHNKGVKIISAHILTLSCFW